MKVISPACLLWVAACAEVPATSVRTPSPLVDVETSVEDVPEVCSDCEPSSEPSPESNEATPAVEPEPALTTPVEQRRVAIPGARLAGNRIAAFELDVIEVTVEAYARCVAAGVCDPTMAEQDFNAEQPGVSSTRSTA